MSSNLVVLVLGAGPNLGTSIAKSFASSGYKVAVASRSGRPSADGFLSLKADFTKPESILPLFDAVKKEFNSAPSVIVYNCAAALSNPPDSESTLSYPVETFVADLNVNTVSAYVAAQQAVLGFETLPKDTKKSFIYTGNILNGAVFPVPMMMNLGVGKCASAYWIGVADQTYAAKGYRFFYSDQRTPEGGAMGATPDGPAHGEFYTQLAKHEGNVPWDATFVKGKGHVKF